MSAYTLSDNILPDVRIILDRNEVTTDIDGLVADVDTLSLDDIIERMIIPAATQVQLIAPKEYVDWTNITDCTISSDDNMVTVTLGDTFLRFGRAKLASWSHSVSEFVTTDSKEYKRQWFDVSGLKANSRRPLVALVEAADGKYLQLFGDVEDTATIEYCTVAYIPTYTDSTLTLGDVLYEPFTHCCAAYVAEALKDTNKSNNLMQICKNLLSADTGSASVATAQAKAAEEE